MVQNIFMSCHPSLPRVSDCHLILFGRYPVPGKTKTRLIPLLGQVGAAEWHRRQTENTLKKVMEYRGVYSVAFCYTGGGRDLVRRWLGPAPLHLTQQVGGDLGERMRAVLFEALDRGAGRVVLVGTDIPQMTSAHIIAAFDAMDRHELVLGPSRDGGYWLIGLRCKADIFRDIQWGSDKVLDQTLTRARQQGLKTACLPKLNDIDTPSDLKTDRSWRGGTGPYLSVIIPTLNEADFISSVIHRARSPESEIIVADGGSRDATVEIAREAGANVNIGLPGRALQQNAGAAVAQGKILLFLHADTLLPPDYTRLVFECLVDHRVVAGAFQFKTDYDTMSMRLIEKAARIRSSLFQMPYGDQALFMPRPVFEKVGGFPVTPIAEDLYLVRRLARLGRVGLAKGMSLTSGRRWRHIGVWRATMINYLIAIGCLIGVDPHKLAPLYRLWTHNRADRQRRQ
ncbi:MAG: TIGR04283 family arsenosugar biosynthesis glycosyltransferase [Desulfobacteraceae bacterium]